MLFNSPLFLFLFLPLTLGAVAVSRRAGHPNAPLAVLVVASLAFYAFAAARYVPFLVIGIAINYALGRRLQQRPSRALFALGVCINLAPLVWLKYSSWLADLVGLALPAHELPLGISFVTFLQIAFLLEANAGKLPPIEFFRYANFVTFFPHLVSGPILRFGELDPQLRRLRTVRTPVDHERTARALLLIVVGMFKKVVVADPIARVVDPLFAQAASLDWWAAWTAALGFTVQLYADFSAYCEIALGVSLLLGVSIPLNFYSPYKATSITDFWRRWHITLGLFIRDAIYVPLGGNRKGLARSIFALTVAMVLAGLWHGAAGTFVLWGLLHAVLLALHKSWQRFGPRALPPWAGNAMTLAAVVAGWVLFRASSISDAAAIWAAMVGFHGIFVPAPIASALPGLTINVATSLSGAELPVFACGLLALARMANVHEWRLTPAPRWIAFASVASLVIAFGLGSPRPYLYFVW